MSKPCRLCLRQDDHSESLVELPSEDIVSKGLQDIFNIKAEKDDKKPHHICAWCKDKVLDFYLFFLRVKSNETKLEREAIALKIKTEPGMTPITRISSFKINEHKIDATVIVLDSDDEDDTNKKSDITTETKQIQVKIEPGTEKKQKIYETATEESPIVKKFKSALIIPNQTPLKEKTEESKSNNNSIISNNNDGLSMEPKVILKRLPSTNPSKTQLPNTLKQVTPQQSKSNSTPIKPRNNTAPATSSGFAEKLLRLKKNHESMSDEQMIKIFYDLKCNICEMELEFYSFQALAEHYKTDHQEENYRLECCGVKIPRNLLLIHIRHHLGLEKLSLMQHVEQLKTQFFCDLCSETFAKDYILRLHIKFDHGPGQAFVNETEKEPYVCDLCGKTFPRLSHIRHHMRMKHLKMQNRGVSCYICVESFPNNKILENHMLKKHKMKLEATSTTCHICQKPCHGKRLLQRHLLSHMNAEEKQQLQKFKCNFCPYQSYDKNKIQYHESVNHTNVITDFQCKICQRYFNQRLALHCHMMSHLDKAEQDKLKPYKCSYCDMRYLYESAVHTHIGSVHRCNICKKIIIPPQTMNGHKSKAHKDDIVKTAISFNEKGKMRGNYLCDYCDKPFLSNERLKLHLREWHLGGSLYECDWCDAQYNDKRAFESHKMKYHSDKLEFQH